MSPHWQRRERRTVGSDRCGTHIRDVANRALSRCAALVWLVGRAVLPYPVSGARARSERSGARAKTARPRTPRGSYGRGPTRHLAGCSREPEEHRQVGVSGVEPLSGKRKRAEFRASRPRASRGWTGGRTRPGWRRCGRRCGRSGRSRRRSRGGGRLWRPRHRSRAKRCSGLGPSPARRPLAFSLELMYLEIKRSSKETS